LTAGLTEGSKHHRNDATTENNRVWMLKARQLINEEGPRVVWLLERKGLKQALHKLTDAVTVDVLASSRPCA